jgi:hypothetical protein
MPVVQKAKQGKKQRKWDRNRNYCKAYRLSCRREHNKIRRIKKHLVRFPADQVARVAIDRAISIIRGY